MAETPDPGDVDRRNFINGRWGVRAGAAEPAAEIASVLVQARPDRLDAVAQAIEALAGTQIFNRDPKGKLVVVIEAETTGAVGSALNTIALLPDVLSAALVFHASDKA